MATWEEFSAITRHLEGVVQRKTLNRSEQVGEIEALIDKRGNMMQTLPEPGETEKHIVRDVLERDKTINQRLEMIFTGVKEDMRNNKKQKSTKNQYTNPYQNVAGSDGMFLDSKK
ncbi:hypothetical protein AAV35_003270 [Salimicrobium jeotgali]|uniref:Flagellar protein FliT n=1 Tax=Salimicrobium jeotgali TaxID=1230341 RepID=K2FQ11_9BACI|nr:flagellar protein FliT [Salimicrobium jeotgali]AKG03900.1 hypothetical protein AAV35_003270 [Salimicrobium jeotgali]EKE32931.1 flagellar protein [Salimicrobium jeotgali]MBM7695074.1 flagellar protein FliT [Salimicrobium jeotgali]